MRPDRFDVVNFKASTTAAGFAAIAVPFEDFSTKNFPAFGAGDLPGIPVMFAPNTHEVSDVCAVISKKLRRSGNSLIPAI